MANQNDAGMFDAAQFGVNQQQAAAQAAPQAVSIVTGPQFRAPMEVPQADGDSDEVSLDTLQPDEIDKIMRAFNDG